MHRLAQPLRRNEDLGSSDGVASCFINTVPTLQRVVHNQTHTQLTHPRTSSRLPHPTLRRRELLTIQATLARLMARRPLVDPRSGLVPPEGLVSTFTFVTSSTGLGTASTNQSREENSPAGIVRSTVEYDTELEVKSWEGRVVFTDTVPIPSSARPVPAQLIVSPSEDNASINRPSTPLLAISTGPANVENRNVKRQGSSSSSPISVSSSSSPEQDLPRPRAVPRYNKLSSTAYTSPGLAGPEYRVSLPVRPASPSNTDGKPVHPFFKRDFQRSRSTPPPPPSQRPRMVATYSSTSQSTQDTSHDTQDTSGSIASAASQQSESESVWSIGKEGRGIQLVTHSVARRSYSNGKSDQSEVEEEEEVEQVEVRPSRLGPETDEIDAMLADLVLNPIISQSSASKKPLVKPPIVPPIPPAVRSKTLPNPRSAKLKPVKATPQPFPQPKSIPKPRSVALPPLSALPSFTKLPPTPIARAPIFDQDPDVVLPLFRYQDLPNPPKVVYTRDLSEANDLLSCLSGNVMAFDMEWPTRVWNKELGKWVYGGAKTALMQFSDEDLVVLVHVWHMKEMPSKAIEILQSKDIYKVGVQIRGDGLKLIRDYPGVFPEGISSLLELSYMARAADPVGTGPGKALIGLARLVRWCTGKELDKGDVRTGDWSKKLDQQQVDYAANDVVSSVEVFNSLQRKASDNGITLNLDRYCGSTGIPQTKNKDGVPATTIPGGVDEVYGVPPVPMPPRQWRAFNIFKDGKSVASMAEDLGIKTTTCYGYIARAIFILPAGSLNLEQQRRFLAEMPEGAFVQSDMRPMFERMRMDLG